MRKQNLGRGERPSNQNNRLSYKKKAPDAPVIKMSRKHKVAAHEAVVVRQAMNLINKDKNLTNMSAQSHQIVFNEAKGLKSVVRSIILLMLIGKVVTDELEKLSFENKTITFEKYQNEVTLSPNNIAVIGGSVSDENIVILIKEEANVFFELESSLGEEIKNFTQASVNEKLVTAHLKNPLVAPRILLSATNGIETTLTEEVQVELTLPEPRKWGPVFKRNIGGSGGSADTSIIDFDGGRFYVKVWIDINSGGNSVVLMQVFDSSNGNTVGDVSQVNTSEETNFYYPVGIGLTGGGFAIFWMGDNLKIYGQYYNSRAIKSFNENTVINGGCDLRRPFSAVGLANDEAVVFSSYNYGFSGQRVDKKNRNVGDLFSIELFAGQSCFLPSHDVIRLPNNEIILGFSCGFYGYRIDGQHFDSRLNRTETLFPVNINTASGPSKLSVVARPGGGVAFAWRGTAGNIVYRTFDDQRKPIGQEIILNNDAVNSKFSPKVISYPDGSDDIFWVVSLTNGSKIAHQRIDSQYRKEYSHDHYLFPWLDVNEGDISAFVVGDKKFAAAWRVDKEGVSWTNAQLFLRKTTAPKLGNSAIPIIQRQSTIITEAMLNVIDDDPSSITVLVDNVKHGWFELKSAPGVEIFNFTMTAILSGQVRLAHDSSSEAPSFDIALTNGILSSSFRPANVEFTLSQIEYLLWAMGISSLFAVALFGSLGVVAPSMIYLKRKKIHRYLEKLPSITTADVASKILKRAPTLRIFNNIKDLNQAREEFSDDELIIGREIARGAFGSVHEGKLSGTRVAVKKIPISQDVEQQKALKDFEHEVNMMTKLRHPNIVSIYGINKSQPGFAYLIMEFMSGGSLNKLIYGNQSLTLKQRLDLALGICSGLKLLHKKDIVHKDLKSLNILLDGNGIPKIADFGTASVIKDNKTMTAGEGVGSPCWMAPEICQNGKPSKKSDIYSFGMILWEIMAGKAPYENKRNTMSILMDVSNGKRETIPSNCPAEIAHLIQQCWSQDPSERPDVDVIIATLNQIQKKLKPEAPKFYKPTLPKEMTNPLSASKSATMVVARPLKATESSPDVIPMSENPMRLLNGRRPPLPPAPLRAGIAKPVNF
jgi:serine/threonine protein kinase